MASLTRFYNFLFQLFGVLSPMMTILLGLIIGLALSRLFYNRRMNILKQDLLATRLGINEDMKDASARVIALNDELRVEMAQRVRAETQAEQVAMLQSQLEDKQHESELLQGSLTHLKTVNAGLQTRIIEENKRFEERQVAMEQSERQSSERFQTLANRILEESSRKLTEQNKTNLDHVVSPLREQIGEFKKKVDDVFHHESRDRIALREEIRSLRLQTQQINQDAINLTRALKGDQKVQGNWGELVLERVLEQSGLRKGVEYQIQGAFRDRDKNLFKPDVIIHLPDQRDVIIDSKVSLTAYERYTSAEEESEQLIALKDHSQSVRSHIKSLSDKDYSSLEGLRSLDFVLMFMPMEAAFVAAFQHDDQLFSDAFEHKIIVVTPTTLLATLRTIENIWRYERQNENARLIADKAGAVYDKLRGLVEDLEKLGKQLHSTQTTYDGVMNKLTYGNGNLIRQANSFVELGVKVKKTLPKTLLDRSS